MMKSKHLAVVIGMSFVATLFLSGLASIAQAEEVKPDSNQSYSERDAYKENARARLAEQDRQIKELEVKARDGNAEERAEAREKLRDLRYKRATLKNDIARLEIAGQDTWESAKRKVNRAFKDLERSIESVRDYFR
jgi:peptidoglycan hydrolase CwlO-like protein